LCCVRVYYTRSLFWCNSKSKSAKKTAKQEKNKIFFDVFSSSLLKSGKNMGTENVDQRTNRRPKDRTDTSLISLSLSLSLLCRVCIYSQFFFQEEKKIQNHPSEEGAENSPSFAKFLSVCALEMVLLFHQRARGRRKRASAQGRKTNKQRTGETKNLKKCQRGIFQRARAAEILGDFWRRLFTKN